MKEIPGNGGPKPQKWQRLRKIRTSFSPKKAWENKVHKKVYRALRLGKMSLLRRTLYELPSIGLYPALYPNPFLDGSQDVAKDRVFQQKLIEDLSDSTSGLNKEIDSYLVGKEVYSDQPIVTEDTIQSPLQKYSKNDSRLHYLQMRHTDKAEDRNTVVFCHGNGHKIDAFRKQMLSAYKRGYNVVSIGYSEYLRHDKVGIHTHDDIIDSTKLCLEKLIKDNKLKRGQLILNGHSLGSAILTGALKEYCREHKNDLHNNEEKFKPPIMLMPFSSIRDRVGEDLYKIVMGAWANLSKSEKKEHITQEGLAKELLGIKRTMSHDFFNNMKNCKAIAPYVEEIKIICSEKDSRTPFANSKKIEKFLKEKGIENFSFDSYDSPLAEDFSEKDFKEYHNRHKEETGSYARREFSSRHSEAVDGPYLDIENGVKNLLEWYYQLWGANPWYRKQESPDSKASLTA